MKTDLRLGLGGLTLTLCVAIQTLHGGGPREPLTFANLGLYGGWTEVMVSPESPFDFLIIQANVVDGKVETGRWHGKGETLTWNDWLRLARANGKRVIADVEPIVTDAAGEKVWFQALYNRDTTKDPLPLERFLEQFDRFFAAVDEEDLYAITLGEEHVFWNGQQERLEQAYDYVKQRYDVPCYQWYSPSQTGATPGLSFPNLRADGWMADEYFLQRPAIEMAMRMYTILRKPAFQIVWAAPDMPSVPWSERTFWDQYETCRKYNVPIAFFCWHGQDATPASDAWAWQPNATPEMRRVFEDFCVHGARLARCLPPVSPQEWDLLPVGQKQVALTPDETRKGWATYQDAFAKPREIALWLDSRITGLADLQWDSSPLRLMPRAAGAAEARIRYAFVAPRQIRRVLAKISGRAAGGKVEVELTDVHGKALGRARLKDDAASLTVDIDPPSDSRFVLIVVMKGKARAPGRVLAEFAGISIEAELVE